MSQPKTDFIHKLRSYFKTLPFDMREKNLCVCLSGGADSVALLRGMLFISSELEITVKACHFNHGIRGEEADRDETFCRGLCKELGVEIYCGRDDVPAYAALQKMTIEEAARDRRYAFFKRMYEKKKVDYCLTAHNMNDDAETLLLNLMRGSGSYGASSIAPYSYGILRPMLKIQRNEIEAFLETIKQEYINDSSNESDEYTRNYVRHNIIPSMQKVNPCVVEALAGYTESCRIDRDYFEENILQLHNTDLRKAHKALRDRYLIQRGQVLLGIRLNSAMLNEIERALFSGKRKVVPLASRWDAIVCKGRVEFACKEENLDFKFSETPLQSGENKYLNDRAIISLKKFSDADIKVNNFSTTNVITFDNIKGTVYVRNRRIGDKIRIRGINRSLKKLFIDKKIPQEYRNIIPIIFDDEGILYVPFVGISDRAFPSESSIKTKIITTLVNVHKERWSDAYEE